MCNHHSIPYFGAINTAENTYILSLLLATLRLSLWVSHQRYVASFVIYEFSVVQVLSFFPPLYFPGQAYNFYSARHYAFWLRYFLFFMMYKKIPT